MTSTESNCRILKSPRSAAPQLQPNSLRTDRAALAKRQLADAGRCRNIEAAAEGATASISDCIISVIITLHQRGLQRYLKSSSGALFRKQQSQSDTPKAPKCLRQLRHKRPCICRDTRATAFVGVTARRRPKAFASESEPSPELIHVKGVCLDVAKTRRPHPGLL